MESVIRPSWFVSDLSKWMFNIGQDIVFGCLATEYLLIKANQPLSPFFHDTDLLKRQYSTIQICFAIFEF